MIESGRVLPVFQLFPVHPDVPLLAQYITNPREQALVDLLTAPQKLGLPVIAPPGVPADLVQMLRQSYLRIASSKEYLDEAGKRGFDVGQPNSGEELADYVSSKLVSFPPEVVREYRDTVEHQ
jgi:hypothetical protein